MEIDDTSLVTLDLSSNLPELAAKIDAAEKLLKEIAEFKIEVTLKPG